MSTSILPTPLTALDAVNQMLQSMGQGRVNSLESSASVDAESATITLANTCREVQSRGWYFNREYDYPITTDTAGALLLPAGCLKFAVDCCYGDFVERAGRLYDMANHTAILPVGTAVRGTIVWNLPFDDLPHTARQYIGRRAGREFQIGAVGSDLLYKFTREMEEEALAELTREHLQVMRPNAIRDSSAVAKIVTAGGYRIPRWGR